MHLFKKTNDNRVDNIRVRVVAKTSYITSSSPVYLQIWNGTTLQWDTLQTVNDKAANTKFSLDGFVYANDADYYDFGNQIAVRVYQHNDSGSSKTLSIDQVIISFDADYDPVYVQGEDSKYQPVYEATDNKYTEIYPEATDEYTPKYPSDNPQDDL